MDSPSGQYTLSQCIIYFKNRMWLGNATEIQQQVLFALHASAVGGILVMRLHITELRSYLFGHS